MSGSELYTAHSQMCHLQFPTAHHGRGDSKNAFTPLSSRASQDRRLWNTKSAATGYIEGLEAVYFTAPLKIFHSFLPLAEPCL